MGVKHSLAKWEPLAIARRSLRDEWSLVGLVPVRLPVKQRIALQDARWVLCTRDASWASSAWDTKAQAEAFLRMCIKQRSGSDRKGPRFLTIEEAIKTPFPFSVHDRGWAAGQAFPDTASTVLASVIAVRGR